MRRIAFLALLVILGTSLAAPAGASHFRFGHITWKARPDIGPTAVELTVLHAWRRSAFSNRNPGDTLPFAAANLLFGDGTSTGLTGVVVTVNTADDWFLARYTTVHNYPYPGPFTAFFDSCCRIFGLVNASSASFRVATQVDLRGGNTGSPVSSISPILQMAQGQLNTLVLPVAEPDGDSIRCRLAGAGESRIPAQPSAGGLALSVSPSCTLSWDTRFTSVGQLYAAQVIVEESRDGRVRPVALDFIIQIVAGSPPACTLNGPTNHVVPVGQPFALSATGTDPDGDPLTVNHLGLPAGASLSPPAGTTGPSPLTATFSWTPGPGDAGTVQAMTLVFSDPQNLQATCGFSIRVPLNQPPVAQCQDVVVPADALCQAQASIDAGSFDPDGDPLVFTQTPAGPYELGETTVELTVEDDHGASASCAATATVEDRAAPIVECNVPASITPPDAPISFTATATDNCGVVSVEVVEPDCHTFNGAGKRVDKTGSCVVEIEGDTLTVLDSGGVGDILTWRAVATDIAGNVLVRNCRTEVVNPGRGGGAP